MKEKLGYKLRIEAIKQGLNAFTFATLETATEDEYDGNDEGDAA